jgi:serine/threonine protein kinase/tetratricopeptide (TPR) repeat protein
MNPKSFFSRRYLIHEQLGSGGEGVVFRATDRLTGKSVAIKRVRLEGDINPTARSAYPSDADRKILIANEFQTLASLRHPNIISVLNYGFNVERGESVPYFTMEYLPGAQTILEACVGQPLEKKVDLLNQMLQALQYLHQRGILHRDLKPANALIVNGQLKLLDFGLSAYLGKARGTSGTLPYMPPEYMHDDPLSPASDLYSVGIVAYELFAGRHPFAVDDPSRLLFDILFHEPNFENFPAPSGVTQILEKLLAKPPDQRFQKAQDVIYALSAALNQPLPPETEAIRESFLRRATFVGREPEMEKLAENFTDLLLKDTASHFRAWLIEGESGVGKSRLLSEFRARVLVQGGTVLQGRSFALHDTPYRLWHDPLQLLSVLTTVNEEQASVLKAIVPDIERVLPGMPFILDPLPFEGSENKSRLLSVLRKLFHQITMGENGSVPVVLILDDIHWAGSESLDLLRDLQEAIADLPVMMLASYQSDEAPDLASQLQNFCQMSLPRLGEADVTALSIAMLGATASNPKLVKLLFRETEGNVLFLIETIRALAEKTGGLTEIGKKELPGSVRVEGVETLLAHRLERVPEEARQLLSLAAVMGRKLDPALLQHSWMWRIEWEQWLLTLSNAAIIHLIEGNQWAFTHEKLRTVILGQLTPRRLRELHGRSAQVIEEVYPESPAHYGNLVFHWREAGEPEREFHYLSLAGAQMLRTSAYQEAVEYYQRGLALMERGDVIESVEKRAEFLNKQASALSSLGDYEPSNHSYQSALAFSQEFGLEKGVADGYHGLAKNYDALGNYREAQNFYGWALAIFEKLEDAKGAARIRMGLGRVAHRLSSFEEAKLAFLTSLDIFRQLGDKQGEGSVLSGLGDTARVQGDFVLAKQYYLEAEAVYQTIGNREGISMIFNNLGVLAETQGVYEEAIVWHQKSLDIKREIGSRQGIAISLNNIGVAYYSMNDFEASRQYAEETAALYKALNDRQGLADSFNNLGLLDFRMENYYQARERLATALKLCEEMGDQWGVALAQLNLGKVARELHAHKIASGHFQEAIEIAQILKLDSVILQTLIEQAPILIEAGAITRAVLHLSHAFYNPKTPGFERSLASALLKKAKNQLAEKIYDRVCEEGKTINMEEIIKRDFGLKL